MISESRESRASWFVPSSASLKLISLGFDQLVADCLWLQFIQRLGDTNEFRTPDNNARSSELAAMLDAITSLDPHFARAYFFTATVIGGELKDPKAADRLLQRGVEANPSDWYIPFVAGINQYLYANDESQAAKYYRMASKFPAAPTWLAGQAKILEAHIPSTIKRINIWQKVYETTQEAVVKQRAREELCALWVHVRAHSEPKSEIRLKAERELQLLGVNIFQE